MAKKKKDELIQAGFVEDMPVCPYCGEPITHSVTVDVDSYVKNDETNKTLLRFMKRCEKCRKEYFVFKTMITLKDGGHYVKVNEEEYVRKQS